MNTHPTGATNVREHNTATVYPGSVCKAVDVRPKSAALVKIYEIMSPRFANDRQRPRQIGNSFCLATSCRQEMARERSE